MSRRLTRWRVVSSVLSRCGRYAERMTQRFAGLMRYVSWTRFATHCDLGWRIARRTYEKNTCFTFVKGSKGWFRSPSGERVRDFRSMEKKCFFSLFLAFYDGVIFDLIYLKIYKRNRGAIIGIMNGFLVTFVNSIDRDTCCRLLVRGYTIDWI